jgi:hypothetical protein
MSLRGARTLGRARRQPRRTAAGRPAGLARIGLALALAILRVSTSIGAAASAPEPARDAALEYEVKAAFLYNFAKFVDWPEDAPGTDRPALVIGVLGVDPFGESLDAAVRGKTVNGRALSVRRFAEPSDLEPCQILFVSASQARRLPEILTRLAGTPVLTVGEPEKFNRNGGIVRLVTEDNKVRFEINVDAAEHAGLQISSKLLALARIVHGRDAEGH